MGHRPATLTTPVEPTERAEPDVIVYGDPQRRTSVLAQVATVHALMSAVTEVGPSAQATFERLEHLDRARRSLIAAGCLEQAVGDEELDADVRRRGVELVQAITDDAAHIFHAAWVATQDGDARPPDVAGDDGRGARFADITALIGDRIVTVKEPEGFAFYALYAEQSLVAALAWAGEHPAGPGGEVDDGEPILVVGVRSIGTTLSAVVAAALEHAGRSVRRITLRPTGAPFDRHAQIDADELGDAAWVLVVDEGPGLSGSSMASVAEAVERAGLRPGRVAFLPGHGNDPGAEATPPVRARWARTPRYVAAHAALRWSGEALAGLLAARTSQILVTRACVDRVEDLSRGEWRRVVYPTGRAWPAACAPFERTKLRCVLADGTAVLWRYVGTDDTHLAGLRRRATRGFGPEVLGTAHGFVATRWIDGRALVAEDAAPAMVDLIGAQLDAVTAAPLTVQELRDAIDRIGDALHRNTSEALGVDEADRVAPWRAGATAIAAELSAAACGDGRPAPHGWIRDATGR
ncbi:MAG: Cell division protein FtsK, partial [Ilumatobacteraceae bacterium]|nr:Cell division protein FtsK [Ilumatobacteraceae bacterium]